MFNHRLTAPIRRNGFSLVEVLVAMTLSLITTATMLGLMSSSLASTANIVHMTKLTDDLRVAMMMMSRDVRRSNYTADSINCYANPDCVVDGSLSSPGDVFISEANDCFVFRLDRDSDGDATEDSAGGFRRTLSGGVGVLQMWVGEGMAECTAEDSNWAAVTDANLVEVTGFTVDDALSYNEVVFDDGAGNQFNQKVRRLRLSLSGQLRANADIQRNIEDVVKLRNNLYL
jgi:prepilin peptidase dependent protein B